MNKAFTREIEDRGDHCPACGSLGREVLPGTLAHHLPAAVRDELAETAFFCPLPTCDVAYFDRFERIARTGQLLRPVYPKDPAAPICPCFGLTCEEIEADAEAGNVTRIRAHLARAQSDAARCATASPSGESCIAAVQRHYMRLRNH